MMTCLALVAIAFVISLGFMPIVIRTCRRLGLLDHNGHERKIHETPVPRSGGIVIVVAFFAAYLSMFVCQDLSPRVLAGMSPKVLSILLPALVVFVLGLVDDLKGVRARHKFVVQIGAAVLLLSLGIRFDVVPFSGMNSSPVGFLFGAGLTILWIVTTTNAFNLIDGMDGLAGGISIFVCLAILAMGFYSGHVEVTVIAAPALGAVLGFLPYNWHPARIFMGDGGSYFLGFVLGALSLIVSSERSFLHSFSVPVILMGIPLLDTFLAFSRRLVSGRPIFQPDRSHIHHKLLKTGFHYRAVVLVLCFFAASMAGLATFTMVSGSALVATLVPLALGIVAVFGVRKLGYDEFGEFFSVVKRQFLMDQGGRPAKARMHQFREELAELKTVDDHFALLERFLHDTGFHSMQMHLKVNGNGPQSIRKFEWSWQNPASPEIGIINGFRSWELRVPLHSANGDSGWILLNYPENGRILEVGIDQLVHSFGRELLPQIVDRIKRTNSAVKT